MSLGGAGGTADAVSSRAAAEEDDLVSRSRALAADMVSGRGTDDSADLHALCHIAWMIELGDLAGCKADLVAVGGIACCSRAADLALRKLALERLGYRLRRVACAGHAHGLIDIGTARERVSDGAADAGGSSAERLDLGRVVVCLVLEEEEPVLGLAVHIDRALDGAGIDLFGLIEGRKYSFVLQILGTDRAHVHEAERLLVAAKLVAGVKVALEGLLHDLVVDLHIVEVRAECRVAAVVGPVGVDHLDLGDGRHAAFACKVALAELDVGEVHGKATIVDEGLKTLLVEVEEAFELFHHLRLRILGLERRLLLERCLAGLDRVDHIALDLGDIVVCERALEHIDLGRADKGALALRDELHALACRVCTLVELAGERLDGEDIGAFCDWRHLLEAGVVHLRLAEDGRDALVEEFVRDAFDVVAVDDAELFEAGNAEHVPQLMGKVFCLSVVAVLLLHVDALDHGPTFPGVWWHVQLNSTSRPGEKSPPVCLLITLPANTAYGRDGCPEQGWVPCRQPAFCFHPLSGSRERASRRTVCRQLL